jgi:hypothetical protein
MRFLPSLLGVRTLWLQLTRGRSKSTLNSIQKSTQQLGVMECDAFAKMENCISHLIDRSKVSCQDRLGNAERLKELDSKGGAQDCSVILVETQFFQLLHRAHISLSTAITQCLEKL